MKKILQIVFLCLISLQAFALAPEKRLENEKQEERALRLFSEIRCLVCEAQSIEGSSTEFSSSMRKIIRQKIAQNKSDKQIKEELTSEFGEKILMSTRPNSYGILPWVLPFIFAVIFGILTFRTISSNDKKSKSKTK